MLFSMHIRSDEGGEIVVGFALYEDQLEVMVADSGQSFDLEKTVKRLGHTKKIDKLNFFVKEVWDYILLRA